MPSTTIRSILETATSGVVLRLVVATITAAVRLVVVERRVLDKPVTNVTLRLTQLGNGK
jgi:hypothetical protein